MSSASTFSKLDSSDPEDYSAQTPESDREDSNHPEPGMIVEKPITGSLYHGNTRDGDEVTVLFTSSALSQIVLHVKSELNVELGGVMLGHVRHRVDGLSVEILASIPAETEDKGPSHFTFTAESWSAIHRKKDERYDELQIVGWYHSHPDLGAFYSRDDVIVHSAAFVLPWHVSLVADPVRQEVCLVGWRNRREHDRESLELAPISGFYEVLNHEDQTPFDWEFVQLQAWSDQTESNAFAGVKGAVYAPSSSWPALPTISPWWGVLVGTLSLLMSLILLLDRLISAGS